ncbi:hypothetical protein [Bradyrhizobium sp. Ec3.3]|uniref:hypothetical protein n=1 Tax=Bradyrhizobium sp. Ec3.3 TaxID=189753 RepID=UPI00048783DA
MFEAVGYRFTSGGGFQKLSGNMRADASFVARNARADLLEDRAQKLGGSRIHHLEISRVLDMRKIIRIARSEIQVG